MSSNFQLYIVSPGLVDNSPPLIRGKPFPIIGYLAVNSIPFPVPSRFSFRFSFFVRFCFCAFDSVFGWYTCADGFFTGCVYFVTTSPFFTAGIFSSSEASAYSSPWNFACVDYFFFPIYYIYIVYSGSFGSAPPSDSDSPPSPIPKWCV